MSFNNISEVIELRKLKSKFELVEDNNSALFDTSNMNNYRITVFSELEPENKFMMDFSLDKSLSGHLTFPVALNSLLDTMHLYKESDDVLSFIRDYTSLNEDELTEDKISEVRNTIEKAIDNIESFFSPAEIEYMLYDNITLEELRDELNLDEDNTLDKKI